jgi:site-specific DNA-methyltransferase (adenine-specific)
MNTLYYGDNLKVLRKYLSDESVDLIYLDPPFNSKRAYNVIFPGKEGKSSLAQIQAFEDTWHWNEETQEAYDEIIMGAKFPTDLKQMMQAFRTFMRNSFGRENDLLAYLTMMAIRLVELWRILKPTGSIYLHCDPTASHYLKILMDQIFGVRNFRNEIIWCYTRPSNIKNRYPRVHNVILFYSRTDKWSFDRDAIRIPYHPESKARSLRGAGTKSAMGSMEGSKRLHKGGKVPEDWWVIPEIQGNSLERLGYPTQKPLALLERIIQASSNEGEVVLDPFCGCGTAVVAAEKLGRKWVGIDITYHAIGLIKNRLDEHFPDAEFQVIGVPESFEDAQELARQSKSQFEAWAVYLLGGQPYKSKGGGDTGIDGLLYFKDFDKDNGGKFHQIIIEVKGGNYQPKDIRNLLEVMKREGAPLGLVIALNPPTAGMLSIAAEQGKWKMPGSAKEYPVLQIFTIQDYFDGKRLSLPDTSETLKKAKRELRQNDKTKRLL